MKVRVVIHDYEEKVFTGSGRKNIRTARITDSKDKVQGKSF